MKISRLDFQTSFILSPQCVTCCTKLSNSGMKAVKLTCNFQDRVQVNLLNFCKLSEKQKLLSNILTTVLTKGREETKIKEASFKVTKKFNGNS